MLTYRRVVAAVNGGVRGVGDYINGRGEKIKRSMAADGPVKTAKKTPVELVSKAPAQVARPIAAPPKSMTGATQVVTRPAAVQRPTTRSPAEVKTRLPPSGRPEAGGTMASISRAKDALAKPMKSDPTSIGKARISAASRPKPTINKP